MRNLSFHSVTAILLVVISAGTAFAGAWTSPKYAFYDKVAFNYYYADHSFDADDNKGATPLNGKFTDHNVSNYLDFGLTDDITLINAISFKWLENETDLTAPGSGRMETRGHGLGDVDLGVRYKILDRPAGIVSTQLLMKIPGPYGRNDPLPLGNGQFDAEARLLYGRSLYPTIPGYANLEIGYRFRADAPSDELRYLVEFGVDITRTLYARAKLDGILSMNNGSASDGSGNPTTTNNFDLGKLDLTVGYKITPSLGAEISYVPELYGRNTAAGATYSVAIFYKTP